jgi:hypothetical protein
LWDLVVKEEMCIQREFIQPMQQPSKVVTYQSKVCVRGYAQLKFTVCGCLCVSWCASCAIAHEWCGVQMLISTLLKKSSCLSGYSQASCPQRASGQLVAGLPHILLDYFIATPCCCRSSLLPFAPVSCLTPPYKYTPWSPPPLPAPAGVPPWL